MIAKSGGIRCCGDIVEGRDFRIRNNAIANYDPTRTITLRNSFVRDVEKRFNWLKKQVWVKVVEDDFLQPSPDTADLFNINAEYPHSASKAASFKRWLDDMVEEGILETNVRDNILRTAPLGWTDKHVQSAYTKGIKRAQQEMRKVGISAATNPSFHAGRLGLMYTNTFNELEGVTKAMNQQMTRTLAQGMAEGLSPRNIARNLNDRIEKVGKVRGRTMARTEIIRAHHEANLNEYELAGVEGVEVKAEWVTAGNNVCPRCQGNEGTVWKLEDMRGAIPAHANCRCVIVPVVVDPRRRRGGFGRQRGTGGTRPQNVKGVAGFLSPCPTNANELIINAGAVGCIGKRNAERIRRAKENYSPATKAKQDLANLNEGRLARMLGGKQTPNNQEFDVLIGTKTKHNHMIEVKTVIGAKEDRVPMRKDSRLRKEKFHAKHRRVNKDARMHTVAIDVRGKKPQLYHREGVGAYRFGSMTKVSPKELRTILGSKTKGKIPNFKGTK